MVSWPYCWVPCPQSSQLREAMAKSGEGARVEARQGALGEQAKADHQTIEVSILELWGLWQDM